MNWLAILPLNAKVIRLLITVCLLQAAIFGCYFAVERGFPQSLQHWNTFCNGEPPTRVQSIDEGYDQKYKRLYDVDSNPQLNNSVFPKNSPKKTTLEANNNTGSGRLSSNGKGGIITPSSSLPLHRMREIATRRKESDNRRVDILNKISIKLSYKTLSISEEQEETLMDVIGLVKNPPFSTIFSLENIQLDLVPELSTTVVHPWFFLKDKLERLEENPIYKKFAVDKLFPEKRKVDLLIIVSSAPGRVDRRRGIRETWWSECTSTKRMSVKCVFITDWRDPNTTEGMELLEEKKKYKDLAFQNLKGGVEFGSRFLFHMVWAMKNFDFGYLMRIDDDYFLCLSRLMKEIPVPPKPNFHWGFVHCEGKDLVWPDESIMLFSRDVIERFLGQDPNKMLCHPHADQMIAIWKKELSMDFNYNSDARLHHHPPASSMEHLQRLDNICDSYIGLHGTYPKLMKTLWMRKGNNLLSVPLSIYENIIRCPYRQSLRWELLSAVEFIYLPKLCVNSPTWNTLKAGKPGEMYIGREGRSGSGSALEDQSHPVDESRASYSGPENSSRTSRALAREKQKIPVSSVKYNVWKSQIISPHKRIYKARNEPTKKWNLMFK